MEARHSRLLPAPHGDHHGFWIDPQNPDRMINGNDGGATISVDGGKSWSTQYNQPTAQFYHVAADNQFLYYVYGAQQDNSTVGIASRTDEGYIGRQHWLMQAEARAVTFSPIPRTRTLFMRVPDGGVVTRLDRRTQSGTGHHGMADGVLRAWCSDLKYRLGWTQPILISPHDPHVIYTTAERFSRRRMRERRGGDQSRPDPE